MDFYFYGRKYRVEFDIYRIYMNNLPILIPSTGLVEVSFRFYGRKLRPICVFLSSSELAEFRNIVLPIAYSI